MIEYTVILVALTTTLYSVTQSTATTNVVGMNKDENHSLMQALHARYSAQNLALRISEMPERSTLTEIESYYATLGKFPTMREKMGEAVSVLNKVSSRLNDHTLLIDDLADYVDPDYIKEELIEKGKTAIKKEIEEQALKEFKRQLGIP